MNSEPYLRVARCRHVPAHCCRPDKLAYGGDLWCVHGLWRRHGRCQRQRGTGVLFTGLVILNSTKFHKQ